MSWEAKNDAALRSELNGFDRLARRLLIKPLSKLHNGQITLDDASGTVALGEPADLHTTIRVRNPRFFRHAVLGGTLSVAESYLHGDWDCDDLTALFRIFVRNMETADQLDRGPSRLMQSANRWYHWWHANTKSGSRRNIHAHYDLGNDFFKLWLDDTLAYSSGIFATSEATLREASVEKFDRICRKLQLAPRDHVVEIGTGWGGFAMHAAGRYGCRVTTTTISQQQYDLARERIRESRLHDRVEVLLCDYRDLTGKYDKLVSIEMIEAVGEQFFDTYFRKCGELLRPNGSFVLQAIVMPERRFDAYLRSVDFIQRYVFPGGCLPSIAAALNSVGRASDLRFVHGEDFAPHYAETLRRWRLAFQAKLDDVRQQGYSEAFIRLWNYYLCYCEAVFEERYTGVVQLQFDKPQCRRDPIEIGLASSAVPRGEFMPRRDVPLDQLQDATNNP
ncbi:MAG: class I SAM-dependent methyltransferase [Planctomycetaceae bacterium]|nr:class I SAM-dependent methyltransferase [Planctomycetaceae bacterium]